MSVAPSQPRPMEVLHINCLRGHLHQFKSFKRVQSSNKSTCKTGKIRPLNTKLQKRRSCPEFGKRLRGSNKNMKPSQGDKQQHSLPRPEGSTLIEKGQGSRSSSTLLRSFVSRSLRSSSHLTKTTSTHHLHLRHASKYHTPNTHHHQHMKATPISHHHKCMKTTPNPPPHLPQFSTTDPKSPLVDHLQQAPWPP
jgi:hypothetical protein